MNRKQKIIISVTGIFIVLLILVGLTYAYFLTRIQGNTNIKSISVTTADLKLIYGDGNGDIVAEKIQPGTTIDTKTFTVKNEGNATVNNYAVYLEELVNTLSRTSDMVYTLTCTSSVSGKTCNGVNETTFPTQNGLIVTNNIDVNETQSYELKVVYKEMNIDQSEDMNKTIGAKVQIYNLADIVDITGTVTNASTGDYVEMQSNPKTSQIRDNKYFIPAVEPGVHTLYVKDSKGTVKGSKKITINKGSTASVNGDTVTITSDSQTISLNITNISSTLTTDIETVKDYNPFNEGTLAYNILTSAKNKTNGTEFLKTPKTKPAEESSSKILKGTDPTTFTRTLSNATNYYISYADDYTVNETTGKFTLVNPTIATAKYTTDMASSLVGKYAVWNTSKPTVTNTQNQRFIYKISTNVSDITSTIKYEYIDSSSLKTESRESTLSITPDDNGTSYYYRGGVEDNYVNFAGMCWRIVRIQGDGSVKLILEDYNTTCNSSTYTGNWSDGNTYVFGYDSNFKADFVNNMQGVKDKNTGLADALKSFQTTKMSSYLDKLKVDDWCYDHNVVSTDDVVEYYGANKRIYTDKSPSLVCSGTKLTKYKDGTDMYVGTLTADEISYAGAKVGSYNYSYYIMNNYAKNSYLEWWTLSPSYWYDEDGHDYVFRVGDDGLLSDDYVVYIDGSATYRSFRPAVSLKSSVEITSGDGTISNPYTVG